MKRIIDYIKKNYILCMVFIAVFLVVVGSIIIIKMLVPKTEAIYPTIENIDYYNFFETQRYDFVGKVTYEKDKIIGIECKDCGLSTNGLLYYDEKEKVTLDNFFQIVFYYQNSISYKLPMFTEIEYDEGTIILTAEGKQYLTSDFFLFNGEDLYFFINDITLTINGQNYELSKYSFISARGNEILYYNYGADKPILIENIESASVRVGSVNIDLLKAVVVDNNKRIILTSEVANLPEFKEI